MAHRLEMDFSHKEVMLLRELIQPLALVWNLTQGLGTSVNFCIG